MERLGAVAEPGDGRRDGWATVWTCTCGYSSAGRARCIHCGKDAPAAGGASDGDDRVPPGPSARAGRKAGRTVAATIGLNLLLQVGVGVFAAANDLGLAATVRVLLFTGVAYYAAVAAWVSARSVDLGVRPRTGRSTALVGAAEGFVIGGGGAILLVGLLRVAVGRAVLDPTNAVLAGQSSVLALVVGILVIAVLAPVVEELVFRGFLAEAFRARGTRVVVLVSAVSFSLAHLQLAGFRYYVAMGVVFTLVYLRRGLIGSIAAHAAFNAMLVLVAVAASHGPAQQVRTPDFSVTVPAAWVVTDAPVGRRVQGDDLVVDSPLGSRVELVHMDGPGRLDTALLTRGLARGAAPLPPGVTLDPATVAPVDFPSGPGVAMSVDVDGHDGRVVMIPKGNRLWVATLRSGGEAKDTTAFFDIVRSWRL